MEKWKWGFRSEFVIDEFCIDGCTQGWCLLGWYVDMWTFLRLHGFYSLQSLGKFSLFVADVWLLCLSRNIAFFICCVSNFFFMQFVSNCLCYLWILGKAHFLVGLEIRLVVISDMVGHMSLFVPFKNNWSSTLSATVSSNHGSKETDLYCCFIFFLSIWFSPFSICKSDNSIWRIVCQTECGV